MWKSLCNFLCSKLFTRQEEKFSIRESDSCNQPYGKRLKLSESVKKNFVNTPPRLPMQAKENVEKNNVEDDDADEGCCVIADLSATKKVGSTLIGNSEKKPAEIKRFKLNKFGTIPEVRKSTFIASSSSDDDEIVVINHLNHSSKGSENLKTENKKFKFFTTPRSRISKNKTAKPKLKCRNFARRKKNLLQECYRLTEKFQYLELVKSQTSCNSFEKNQSRMKELSLPPLSIPIIDLTDEENGYCEKKSEKSFASCSTDDSDVQIVKEIVAIRSLEDMLKIRPVSAAQAFRKQEMLWEHQSTTKPIQNVSDHKANNANDKETCLESLEAKLCNFMQISKPEIREAQNKQVEYFLPELTPHQEHRIQEALILEPSQEVLVEGFGLSIRRRDMNTLKGLNWLNDEVINFYMNLIMERRKEKKKLPKVYAFSTFFYPKLVSSGYYSLRKWTKNVDIFSYDLLLVPIHLQLHWCMLIVDFRSKSVKYYDSIGSKNDSCLERLLEFLQSESVDKKNKVYHTNDWIKVNVEDIPQQMNGSDCGVFSCMFAEHLAREAEMLFTQNDMPYFRKKMVIELLDKKLMT